MTAEATYTFRKIAAKLEKAIVSGELRPGERIPSVRELAELHSVAPLTARRAIKYLCSTSRVQTMPGRGTYVLSGNALEGLVLVLPTGGGNQDHPISEDLLSGARETCVETGIPALMTSVDDDLDQYLHGRYAFLIASTDPRDVDAQRCGHAAAAARRPFVSVGADCGLPNHIGIDGLATGRLALRYLRSLGHERIAFVPRVLSTGRNRFEAPRDAHAGGTDLRVYPFESAHRDWGQTRKNVQEAIQRAREEFNPTAYFVGPDQMAVFALEYLIEQGVHVPEDVSILVHCREVYSTWMGKRLTRIDNPHQAAARRAAEELVKMGAGGGYACGRINVEATFYEGDLRFVGPVNRDRLSADPLAGASS